MAKVRIEREVCTGAGDCARAVPDVFWMAEDGLAMVKEEAAHFGETVLLEEAGGGFTAWARVPDELMDAVDQAAANCPGMCIVVEHDAPAPEPEPAHDAEAEDEPAAPQPRSSIGARVKYRLRNLFG